MNTLPRPHPLVVVILDGWGVRLDPDGNAIAAAQTPTMDRLLRHFPAAVLGAAGLDVGLPAGVAGNSEVGHRNIGAGRVEYQLMTAITQAITDGSFFHNHVLTRAITSAQAYRGAIHLMGLISHGNVHSSLQHLFALLQLLAQYPPVRDRIYIHLFTDGRDSPPRSALQYVDEVQDAIGRYGAGTIASVCGRAYAMDRNENWDRTAAAYAVLTGGERGPGAPSAQHAIERAYAAGLTDEMIPPTVITRGGAPVAIIGEGDAVIFFNFRADRARQLTAAFTNPESVPFTAAALPRLYFVTFADYDPRLAARAAFASEQIAAPLARIIADAGLTQLHIAETEKYAHVTYFLNVGHEQPFPGERHQLIRSAAPESFAANPSMAAEEITREALTAMQREFYDVYFINFANPDMVGHTGDFTATMAAVAAVDQCLGQLFDAVVPTGGALLVTADHGKAEQILVAGSAKQTAHTTSPVPFYYARRELEQPTGKSDTQAAVILTAPVGVLADAAPTILDILRIQKPTEMTGVSLLGSLR
ncbi:MAG: 2,3-bisphosphoglycerate-independent phosphoglycerate mutase [Candidatus Andersenbacteria bacterium CG10_big_fil_rev_8_21_14_0_10_54_11]|uniref:2,3-bisphosphoglycerate-independent phosphoglycerate mutase n=1 Tax=Candidatus Andersenbacteria bacterium CG10_big_fil_rev_8_21_14_0_10_54_11 TaxID=1974485 RepID=A0A2M6WY52_9BACT|nr:MAG: 2,3-bisphosphoglycerate-independent phosphoglycerate mutase [Candidatus Andersenbacteria bacterium CG10_big_fil_rev_8_21_14_0_10_54_11]